MAQDRGLLTAREREAYFQFKDNGPSYRLKSFLFGGAGDKENGKFNEHRHDGRNFVSDTVMVGIDATISGSFSPYYGEMPVLARNFFGQPKTSDLIDASYSVSVSGSRRREVFEWPLVGAPLIDLWTLQVGECKYGRAKLRSWNADVSRNADGGSLTGSAAFHANDILDYNAAIPGTTAQNAKFTITAANVTGALGVAYRLPGATTSQTVSMAIADTTTQTKAKFEAFGDGVVVNVVGTIATGTGERHTVVGSGNTFSLYGGAVTVDTATATTSTIQTAIRALTGRATATVTGTITVPVAGTPTSFTVSGMTNDAGYNGTYVATGTANRWSKDSTHFLIYLSGTWLLTDSTSNTGSGTPYSSSGGTATTPPASGWTVNAAGFAPGPAVAVTTSTGGTPGQANLTITYNSTDGNVGDIEAVPGAGYVGTTTPMGANGGTVTVEFTTPANSAVTLTKVSGVAGYTVAETQPGSDGTGPRYITDSPPIESDNVLIYMGDTRAQLDAISPDDDNNAQILLDVVGHTFSVGDTWNPVWTENRSQAPSNFVGTLPTIGFGLTVIKGTNSEALRILQAGCVVGKKFFRISYKCGGWQWWVDLKATRNATQDKGADNDLPTRTNAFVAADSNTSVFRMTCIGPATDYFIP